MVATNECDKCNFYDGKFCIYFQIYYDCKPIEPKRTSDICEHYENFEELDDDEV